MMQRNPEPPGGTVRTSASAPSGTGTTIYHQEVFFSSRRSEKNNNSDNMEAFICVPFIKSLKSKAVTLSSDATVCELLHTVTETHGLPRLDFYVKNNGRLSSLDDIVQHGGVYHLEPRLPGGKGGFGSMLRALGAQIEKTTNREACRDLSGRRLRDVNHEKEMAEWLQKQGEREAEKEQRRLDRIQRKLSEPKHHFTDPQFHQQCHHLSERLDDSVLKGMQASSSALVSVEEGQEGRRGKRINKSRQEDQQHAKKTRMWTGVDDLDSSEDDDDDDDDDEGLPSISPVSQAAQRSVEPQLSDREQSSSTAMETEPQSSAESSSSGPQSSPAEPQPGPSVRCDPSGSQCDPSAPEANSPQHSEQKQTEAPVDPEVTTSGPVDPEVSTPGPVDPEVATSGPVDPEVAISGPVDPAVTTLGPVDLEVATSAQELEVFGLELLKVELMSRGLKCGGTLSDRAARLFSVKGLKADQINPLLMAKAAKGKKK